MLRGLLLALACLGLLACRAIPIGAEPPRMGLSREEIERFARITLCDAASDVNSYTEKEIDRFTLVKFRVPAADVDRCVRAAGYTDPLKEFTLTFGETTKIRSLPAWWTPATAASPLAGEKMESGFFRKMMVDRADPARPVIYLSHYEF